MDGSRDGSQRRRRSSASSSPEFEFWAVGKPPQQLITADELFSDGVILPLHRLSLRQPNQETDASPGSQPEPETDPCPPRPLAAADIAASISCSPASGSKRWKDIFRVGEKKEQRRKERKAGAGAGAGAAELNINIWPFSRSRSAGSAVAGGGRPRVSVSGRRVSSAPCSRSNSRGESSKHPAAAAGGRRWAASPGRPGGVPVGRASPVWQIRRPEQRDRDKVTAGRRASGGPGLRVLNMNVNTCIGYRGQRSCSGDDKDGVTARARTASDAGGGTLFSLKALFSKKVY
ncbi:hypothetical protein GW17_00001039 [Ensete ventricosum]|nr:hypothetical protein GW17_00001039 [Ensete ventricosum]